MFRILAYGATHVGRERKNNEDAFRISAESGLYLVCDGMGGHASGEIASQIASDAMVRFVSQDIHRPDVRWPIDTPNGLPEESRVLDAAVRIANSEVFAAAQGNPLHKGMGTTIVAVLAGHNRLGLVHVGDSRIYRLREGELTQVTEDHSLLNFYIQTRPMSAEQIRQFAGKNVIVRAVGLRDAVEPDVQVQDYQAGDIYLLCSDGVTDMVDDAIIAATLQDGGGQLAQTAERLIDHALNGGGKDNITVVLLQVVKVPDESRSRLSARSTLPMDTDEMSPEADRDDLEDTSPGFDIRTADPSDAETLTEIEVRQTSILRKHARTQEVPYRPWQQAELNAPARPGVPLPYRRGVPLEVQVSADVDTQSPTDPETRSLSPSTRVSQKRPELAATAKHTSPRESQPLPATPSTETPTAPNIADEDEVTAELPQIVAPVLRVRVDGSPYQSGGVVGAPVAGLPIEDTERVDGQARAAQVAAARKELQEHEAAEVQAETEESRRTALRSTAVDKPNPRRSDVAASAPVASPPPKSSPAIYISSTPAPAPNPLTTLDESAGHVGLPLDDDDEEDF